MVVAERTSSQKVDNALLEILDHLEKNGGFKRGELKPFIQNTAEKHDISWHTLKNRYYRYKEKPVVKKLAVKDSKKPKLKVMRSNEKEENSSKKAEEVEKSKVEKEEVDQPKESQESFTEKNEVNNIDLNIHEYSTLTPYGDFYKQRPRDFYKTNQMVDLEVVHLETYGAFCKILDGRDFQGLLHISQITNEYIKNIEDYVNIGDTIRGALISLVEDKRINFSTKHLHLSKSITPNENVKAENPPVNIIGEQYGDLKDKLFTNVEQSENEAEEVEEHLTLETLTKNDDVIVKKYERDIDDMTSFLQGELGALSPKAKSMLAEIIDDEGVFKTTRGIIELQKDFTVDLGVIFMNYLKGKIGDCL